MTGLEMGAPAEGAANGPAAAATVSHDAPPEQPSAPPGWGTALGYPAWFEAVGPQVHALFNEANRYVAVPALRMGLGRIVSSPLGGYLMLLRTRGRTSGLPREAPLGYCVAGEYVYCMAGFGRRTHWFQNVLADPHVEVVLPSRAFSGLAEEVTDPAERRRVLVPLVRSMGLIVLATGLGNPWRQPAETIEANCAAFPLVRIRATGIAAGPHDPGGWGWIAAVALGGWGAWRLARRRRLLAARTGRSGRARDGES